MASDKEKYIAVTVLITFLYSLPFLLSPYNFMDDFYRSSNGDLNTWFYNARPFSTIFFRLINESFFPSDPYPFSFIFSFIILYFILLYTVDKLVPDHSLQIKLSIFIVLLCNPFLLQNLSYKYDCVTMVMSILCACLFVFKKQYKNIIIDYVIRSLLILSLYCFYQPALSFVCGLLAIKTLVDSETKSFSNIIKDVLFKLVDILLVFYIYKICIANFLLSEEFAQAGKVLILNHTFFNQLLANINGYFMLLSLFIYKKYVFISVLILLFMFIYSFIKNLFFKNYKRIVIFIFCTPLLMIAITSPNVVLASPLFHMREMMGVSLVFVFFLLYIDKNKYFSRIVIFVSCCLFLSMFLISSSISSLKRLDYQKKELVVQDVLRAIDHFGTKKVEGINFISDNLESPSQKTILKNYPLLKKLFDGDNFSTPWYANGVINGQFYLHKIVMGNNHEIFPRETEALIGCYTKSALKGAVLYVEVGSFCNSFPKGHNPDFP